ncbi:hypothetical protein ABKV19_004268 [Rosa sericea]
METNGIIVPAEMETEPIQAIPPSEENVSTSAFYPQVRNELKPFKGQQFKTWEEAHVFYTKYASAAGFVVRIGSSKRSRATNEFIRKEFFCNRQGNSPIELTGDEKRIRGVVREDCKARMIVVRDKSGGFVVNIFDEAHTHPMTSPKRLHLLKSNRRLTKAQRSLWEQLSMVNIPTHQQFDILRVQAGRFQYIGCTQQDLYNLERDKRKETKGHDGEMLHDYFLLEQEKNSGFFFTIKADVENRITHCFWADAISRQSYKFYGDVIIFDTTYQTNRYSLIFAPLMGINNHGQTIVFGAAFLSDETTASFVWLLKEFLNAMPGGPPKMIITNQDSAMEKAISEVLPDTFHIYCDRTRPEFHPEIRGGPVGPTLEITLPRIGRVTPKVDYPKHEPTIDQSQTKKCGSYSSTMPRTMYARPQLITPANWTLETERPRGKLTKNVSVSGQK